jgi:hypothetical protein
MCFVGMSRILTAVLTASGSLEPEDLTWGIRWGQRAQGLTEVGEVLEEVAGQGDRGPG